MKERKTKYVTCYRIYKKLNIHLNFFGVNNICVIFSTGHRNLNALCQNFISKCNPDSREKETSFFL